MGIGLSKKARQDILFVMADALPQVPYHMFMNG